MKTSSLYDSLASPPFDTTRTKLRKQFIARSTNENLIVASLSESYSNVFVSPKMTSPYGKL